ncbi:hypothetical protein HPB52_002902 [Rhipicephalus sanguineus]|uniref:Uncharacterized protein n=1 Tax=Rhipicephalus sanguineus TaxID=34632 RepID=A0A9D4PTX4_RHISA|nr:hypothetical protein HPB52_002902 [Rhipicephalus sanguineus]
MSLVRLQDPVVRSATITGSMESPRNPGLSCRDWVTLLSLVVLFGYASGISTYGLWYYAFSDPLLDGCCELADDQYRMLRGKYFNNMTLLKLNQTGPTEYLRDCVILTNSTKQLAPQRCCSERHLLSLTMPSDAFKVYERPLKCGHVACKDISNRLEMIFYMFVLFCVIHFSAYWNVKTEYRLLRVMGEMRRRRELTTTQQSRGVPRSHSTPAVGH